MAVGFQPFTIFVGALLGLSLLKAAAWSQLKCHSLYFSLHVMDSFQIE